MIPKEIRLTNNCDGNCDGRSDFGAKTDFIDTFGSRRTNNLRVINTGRLHPAHRLARRFYWNCSPLAEGGEQSHEARCSGYFPASRWSFAP